MSAQRFSTNEPANIEVYGRRSSLGATMKNLSSTGACLSWHDDNIELKEGDLVCVTVNLAMLKRRHRVNAEVMWRSGKEMGVNFIQSEELVQKFATRTRKAA